MRGVITVVKHDEYVLWLAKQKANYAQVMGDQAPAPAPGGKADSAKVAKN
jgi:dsDNA-binding SOS-regulon protein